MLPFIAAARARGARGAHPRFSAGSFPRCTPAPGPAAPRAGLATTTNHHPSSFLVLDSLSGSKVGFGGPPGAAPPRALTWYTCGPTVYDDTHLGHARTYVALDICRRLALAALSSPSPSSPSSSSSSPPLLLYAMNITDIDDKILLRARERNVRPRDLALRYEEAFFADLASLGVLPPTAAPRVTDHIGDIVDYIRGIQARGLAYEGADGVYMDTRGMGAHYGKLAPPARGGDAFPAAAAADDSPSSPLQRGKRDARDFALWKRTPGDAVLGEECWESPWGRGRPGWHIECTAMASHLFPGGGGGGGGKDDDNGGNAEGASSPLDIHAGGVDLAFPHHCNELCQADAHRGDLGSSARPWVRAWMHTGHLHIAGAKMSKSLKNFVTVRAMLGEGEEGGPTTTHHRADGGAALPPLLPKGVTPSDAFRMYVYQHHYRSSLTYSPQTVGDAGNLVRRIATTLESAVRVAAAAAVAAPASTTASSTRWGDPEHHLASRVASACGAASARFADDFDTPGGLRGLLDALAALQAYVGLAGRRPDPLLTLWAASAVNAHLVTAGFGFARAVAASLDAAAYDKRGLGQQQPLLSSSSSSSSSTPSASAPPLSVASDEAVDALVAFRADVRAASARLLKSLKKVDGAGAGAGAGAGTGAGVEAARREALALLSACDRVRDEALPALGWTLTDATGGPVVERKKA
jgi:cysteinyl-tRNA synthetase